MNQKQMINTAIGLGLIYAGYRGWIPGSAKIPALNTVALSLGAIAVARQLPVIGPVVG